MKITEYNEIAEFSADNVLLVDGGTTGTAKMTAANAGYALVDMTDINNRRSIFRGKYLGTEITDTQRSNIADGSFKDLWLGDYWIFGGFTWRIVDFDYWYGTSSYTGVLNKHHLVIMPDTAVCDALQARGNFTPTSVPMIFTNNTSSSYEYQVTANQMTCHLKYNISGHCLSILTGIFPSGHVDSYFIARTTSWVTEAKMSIQSTYTNWPTTTSSSKSGFNLKIDIPTEFMIFGCRVASPFNSGAKGQALSTVEYGNYQQLALFKVAPQFARGVYVLKDLTKAPHGDEDTTLDKYNNYEHSLVNGTVVQTSTTGGIRPVFAYGM